MSSLDTLDDLTELMLEYNKVDRIQGLTGKKKLQEVNLSNKLL